MNQEPPKPREILFRGYARHGWVYGGINFTQDDTMIGNGGIWHAVYPETVGQFTGKKDKGGKGIFEGDLVRYNGTSQRVIEFEEYSDDRGHVVMGFNLGSFDSKNCEVVGNKFEIGG